MSLVVGYRLPLKDVITLAANFAGDETFSSMKEREAREFGITYCLVQSAIAKAKKRKSILGLHNIRDETVREQDQKFNNGQISSNVWLKEFAHPDCILAVRVARKPKGDRKLCYDDERDRTALLFMEKYGIPAEEGRGKWTTIPLVDVPQLQEQVLRYRQIHKSCRSWSFL